MKNTIAVLNKRGENAVPAILNTFEELFAGKDGYFGVVTPSEHVTEKDVKILSNQKVNSPVAFGYILSKPLSQDDLQFIRQQDATITFDGAIYSPTGKTSLTEALKFQSDRTKMAANFLRETESDFALTIIETEKLIAARDPVGVQPLYYGENQEVFALTSNRRALWALKIKEAQPFPPGHLATVTRQGFKFEPIKTLTYIEPKPLSLDEAAQVLQQLLERSVQNRVLGLKKVAVAFSGGIDSSVIACLAKRYCPNVQLVHVSLENQPETEDAWEAAKDLDLPLQVHLFKEADVETTVPKVLELIEEPEPLKVNVGIPIYWTAKKTAEAKLRVLLAGQGADELFGGYQRYVKEYLHEGDKKVRQTMFNDVANIYESNLERDEKICVFHDVQLRLPFASYEIAEFALTLPTELKFERKVDSLRKLVLRKVATNLGIPESIAQKPKKAVQYSTGISSVLKKLAKKRNTTLGCYLSDLFQKQNQ